MKKTFFLIIALMFVSQVSAKLIFGKVKRVVRPNFIANHTPTHLFRTDAKQQLAFFKLINSGIELKYWRVYETGWPYLNGSLVKHLIARIAIFLSGRNILNLTFGNRFQGIFSNKK